jgi:hypothetical protein
VATEKASALPFRGRVVPEESAFSSEFAKKQIPRFARNDETGNFFRNYFSLSHSLPSPISEIFRVVISRAGRSRV